jgi:hypothetical protein
MPVQISRLSFSPGTHSKEVELVISDPSDQKEIPEIWIQARFPFDSSKSDAEIAPELTGHGLPLVKCEAYNRVYDQPYGSS